MDQHDSTDREQEMKDMLQRAKSSPDRRGHLRQETLSHLMKVVHSDATSLKILAARNMHLFLADFPDLEAPAIDAIYDLCEDSSPKVRLEGYRAISQVSRTRSKWIKRNADVLVQLLQSEEADEVAAVKKALVEHLEMDPRVTLGVLCDQIVTPDGVVDEEEISIRDRLKSLVLRLLVGEAKQTICERHALSGKSAEGVLFDGLFAAIPRLGATDLELVLRDLVYALPAFTSQKPNERGAQLLDLLLSKASPALKLDLHSDQKALSTTRPLLQHCEHMTCTLQAAPAVDLLEFFCKSLIGKITLQKVQATDRQWIVCSLSRILGVAQGQQRDARFFSLRRTIIDAGPYLFEVFKSPTVPQSELSITYGIFLEACLERAKDTSWTPPPYLLKVLQDFQRRPEIVRNKEYEMKIRSLGSMGLAPPQVTSLQKTDPVRKAPTVLPSTSQASGLATATSTPSSSKPVHTPVASTVQEQTKRDIITEISTRPTKRSRVEEVASTPTVPSLLSRLGTSLSRQSSLPELSPQRQSSPISESEPSQPSQGFSIKGAATKQIKQTSSSTRMASSSLLERLEDSCRGDPSTRQHDILTKRRNR